jgi:phosphatidate cytidylyltransferase
MKRVLTAILLVPIAIYSIVFAPWFVFAGVVALFASLSFYEYAKITGAFFPLGLAAGLIVLLAPVPSIPIVLFLTALAALCLPLAASDLNRAVGQAGMLVLGVLYVFGSWKTGMLLHDIDTPGAAHLAAGRYWMLFGLMVNWMGDTGAYYIGRRWGRHKLAPVVSPGKSWEGAVGSAAVSIVFGVIFLTRAIPGVSIAVAGVLALLTNAAGQLGDLAESAIKRSAGVKDSGSMLPGHGGMLDRLDSTLFTLPVLWGLIGILRLGE